MNVDEVIRMAAFGKHPLSNPKSASQVLPKREEDFTRF